MRGPEFREFWPMPAGTQDVCDDLENLACLIEFVTDLASRGGPAPDGQHAFGSRGFHGMYLFLSFIENHLDACGEVIMRERRAKKTEP